METVSINPHGWAICLHTEDRVSLGDLPMKTQEDPRIARLLHPLPEDPQQWQQFHLEGHEKFSSRHFENPQVMHFCVSDETEARQTAQELSKALCQAGMRHFIWTFPALTGVGIEVIRKKEFPWMGPDDLAEQDNAFLDRVEKIPGLWWAGEGTLPGSTSIRAQTPGIVVAIQAKHPIEWTSKHIPIVEIQEALQESPHLEATNIFFNSQLSFPDLKTQDSDYSYEKTIEAELLEHARTSTKRNTMRKA